MEHDERVQYWLNIVARNLDATEWMFQGCRWLYAAYVPSGQ